MHEDGRDGKSIGYMTLRQPCDSGELHAEGLID